MIKKAFTLSEVIVALSIVAVLAAITAPILGNLIPDRNKVKVLKAYKTISEINTDLLSSSYYYCDSDNSGCKGLGCMQKPLDPKLKDKNFEGGSKYPLLLASKLECVGDVEPDSFTTVDGAVWSLSGEFSGTDGSVQIKIDFDPNNKTSKLYSAQNKNPDTFAFNVDVNGFVTGSDPLTKAYLKNPHKLNDRKADLAAASKLKFRS